MTAYMANYRLAFGEAATDSGVRCRPGTHTRTHARDPPFPGPTEVANVMKTSSTPRENSKINYNRKKNSCSRRPL